MKNGSRELKGYVPIKNSLNVNQNLLTGNISLYFQLKILSFGTAHFFISIRFISN